MDIGKQAVGYLRVSTAEQGCSGNGLAAQRSAIERAHRWKALPSRHGLKSGYTVSEK